MAARNSLFSTDDIVAANCDQYFDLPFERNPLCFNNAITLQRLYKIIHQNDYDIVHCHTPVGGVLTRLAAIGCKKTRVIYTAHGFHFFNGATLVNWLVYYPVEWICSWLTDTLITINKEDYERAKRHFHAKKIEYVPGVGIDTEKFSPGVVSDVSRESLGIDDSDIMLLSVGELNDNKNHELVLRALACLQKPNVHYFICGEGERREYLEGLCQTLHIESQVHFLGFYEDISSLCQEADLFVFPSKREGLPVALMEAIACRTPIICSDVRGNRDLVSGASYRFEPNNVESLISCMQKILAYGNRADIKEQMTEQVEANYRALYNCDLRSVHEKMRNVYSGGADD